MSDVNTLFYATYSAGHFLTLIGLPLRLIIPMLSLFPFSPDIKKFIAESPSERIAVHIAFYLFIFFACINLVDIAFSMFPFFLGLESLSNYISLRD